MIVNNSPFPILKTERLILRELEDTDDKDIFAHRSEEKVNQFVSLRHENIEQTQAFISKIQRMVANNESEFWIIAEKGSKKFAGTICLWNLVKDENKAEVGYSLNTMFHGKGYMQEALEKVLEYGFNIMKLQTIEAYTHKDHTSSIKLLKRNNFMHDVTRKPEDGSDNIVFILKR